jgi:chemotaxis protein methyltransferase CheR
MALSTRDFERVRQLIHRIAGIHLASGKEGLVRSRLIRRVHALRLQTVGAYLDRVEGDAAGRELSHLVDVLTTNKTEFFRERAHLECLQHDILPSLAARPGDIRIWSAGCATGEEAYSIAITARLALGAGAERVRILATDISARALHAARAGQYPRDAVRNMDPIAIQRCFTSTAGGPEALDYQVRDEFRALVRFARLNLVGLWPMRGLFDVIFCRNVMIYFDPGTQQNLVQRFADHLTPDGWLLVGHSESLSGVAHGLRYVRPATYHK